MVAIPGKKYKMGKYEVTQAQWDAVMGKNPSSFKGADYPVEYVSWINCNKFIEKLNALPSVMESGLVFRFPSGREWKYACRAGSTGDYCKLADGTEITEETLGEVAWYDDNSGGEAHPVGQKKPNAFGLYDMLGNVREWCGDLLWELRGGDWDSEADCCTASDLIDDDLSDSTGGFRLAASQY